MKASILLPSFVSAVGAIQGSGQHAPLDMVIQWHACNTTIVNTSLSTECANLDVPLDYTAPDNEKTIQLEIARIKAPVQPAKGTILLNFGGPGTTGRDQLAAEALKLLALSGGKYNLAAFDPRGTGTTIPHSCFSDTQSATRYLGTQEWGDADTATLQRMWAIAKNNTQTCYSLHKDTEPYLGTTFVARDLMSAAEALGEDGLLRYWGFSYGTVLGVTVASMFPDKIDGMVLDGVQNYHEYYYSVADVEEWSDSDRVFSEIFRACEAAGPGQCAMARDGLTAKTMEDSAWKLADSLRSTPMDVEGASPLTYPILRGLFAWAIYNPDNWLGLTKLLHYATTNQTSHPEFAQTYNVLLQVWAGTTSSYPKVYGIHCSDRIPRLDNVEAFYPVQEQLSNTSKVMDGVVSDVSMTCAQWKVHAKEPFVDKPRDKPRVPVLISSNTYDGHTPLRSARNLSSEWASSGLLVVDAFGHSTLAQASACTIMTTAKYWLNRTLPGKNFSCAADAVPYSNYTWLNAIEAVYGQGFGANSSQVDGRPNSTPDVHPTSTAANGQMISYLSLMVTLVLIASSIV